MVRKILLRMVFRFCSFQSNLGINVGALNAASIYVVGQRIVHPHLNLLIN